MIVSYVSGPDQGPQAARIARWAEANKETIVGCHADKDRPGDGLIEAVRQATLKSATVAVTSYDRLSPEPIHVALLTAVVRVAVVK